MHSRTIKRLTAGMLLVTMTLAACGSDDGGDAATPSSAASTSAAQATDAPATTGGSETTIAGGDDTPAPAGDACAPEDVVLIGQVRDETNPYEKSWLDGGDEFAASVGLEQKRLTYGDDSTKEQDQIKQELSSGNTSCYVLNILPNTEGDTKPIADAAKEAGAFLVTQWNKPADLAVEDYDRWASHISYDGVESGKLIAETMFHAMGGEGGIVALQGGLATTAAKDRFAGLQEALAANPGIELLDEQTANWSQAEALTVLQTLITKHGDKIKGVWTANDGMALGAMEALDAAGMSDVAVVGIDAVPEAVTAVADGRMTATVSSDGPWQGGVGLAIGYCAAIGEIDIASLTADNRAFYANQTLITADNAAHFATPSVDRTEFDCANVFNRVSGPLG